MALAERYRVEPEELDGWTIAVNLTRSGCRIADPGLRFYAERLAARAVLQRAARLVGPLRSATQTVREPLREPFAGELDVEATLDNVLGKAFPEPGDWVAQRRVDRRHQVVLMVDTSLSMSGENMAIAAVAAAVLALKLHPEDLSVVVFEDKANAVTHLEVADAPQEVVRRMLDQPVRGYTNIEAALELGAAELERGRNPRRSGLLITDGVVTAGGDPRPLAHRFPQLFVLLTEDYKMNPELCRRAGRRRPRRRVPGARLPRPAGAPARRRQPRPAVDWRSGRRGYAPRPAVMSDREECPVALFGPPNVAKLEAAGKIDGLVQAAKYKKDPAVAEAARDGARGLPGQAHPAAADQEHRAAQHDARGAASSSARRRATASSSSSRRATCTGARTPPTCSA